MNANAKFGLEILTQVLANMRVPSRLAAEKSRLVEVVSGLNLASTPDDELCEEIFNLAKSEGWDYVADGPEGELDNNRWTLPRLIDAAIVAKIKTDPSLRGIRERAPKTTLFLSVFQNVK